MAIRPVDMQSVMPRTLEASRANAIENIRPAEEQQQFAEKMQKNVTLEQQSVIQTNKSEGQTVDKDGRNAGGNQYQGNRRGKRGSQEAPAKEKEKKSLLDISL